MNVRALLPLVAGLGIGGVALKVGLDTLQKAKANARSAAPAAAQVWAASVDIPRGAAIREEWLKAIEFPRGLLPEGAVQEKDKLLGRVARIDVPAGLPVLDGMLLAPGVHPGVIVRPGYRAVAVKIDESSGVDFHLEPGCRVDVVGFFTVQGKGRGNATVARTFLENVEVAAVGPRLSPVTGEEDGKAPRQTRAVTLLVKPDKVPLLHLAEQRGKIKLCMRGNADEEEVGERHPVGDAQLIDPLAAQTEQEEPPKEEPPQPTAPVLAAAARPPELPPGPPIDSTWKVLLVRGAGQPEVVRFKSRQSRERVDEAPARSGAVSHHASSTTLANFVPPPDPQQPAPSGVSTPSVAANAPGQAKAQPAGQSGWSKFLDRVLNRPGDSQPAQEQDQEPEEPTE